MSSTSRGGQRNESDFYATPTWAIKRLIEDPYPLPSGRWLEPCAGDGQYIRTIQEMRPEIQWAAGELRFEMHPHLAPLTPNLYFGDFLEMPENHFGPDKFEVAITNPPFSLALPIIRKCMRMANLTVMLLRLNFWGSGERSEFLRTHAPDCLILPNRPVFSYNKQGKPGTDSIEYAHFIWKSEEFYTHSPRRTGTIRLLGDTPIAERREWTQLLKERLNLPKTEFVCEP